jgi:hypothetical protein
MYDAKINTNVCDFSRCAPPSSDEEMSKRPRTGDLLDQKLIR